MSNELINPQAMPLAAPSVGQTGKNNVNVTNQDGGVVNINYNIHPGNGQRGKNDCDPTVQPGVLPASGDERGGCV